MMHNSILELRQHEVDVACRCILTGFMLALREHGHLIVDKAELSPTLAS